ncbi:aspartic peptidase domain-containing protein [Mycena galopus ATCC 62051]|nr:aspartic peptidase domain-containing protein [Mycena galopus ATCC 62051]
MRGFQFYFPVFVTGLVHQTTALAIQGTRVSSGQRRTGTTGHTIFSVLSGNHTLDSEMDMRYSTNITVNGRNFRVAIDTGSADLWLSTSSDFGFNNSGIAVTDEYCAGCDVVGTIGFASVELGGYTFDQQAFNNATTVGLTGILDNNLDGLMGFSFGTTDSFINPALQAAGIDETVGQPFLSNLFDQTPDQQNFLAISLSRTDDLEDSADASFLINEVDQDYADVVSAPAIPLFGNDGRWSILIDGMSLDGVNVPVTPSTTPGVPAGKIAALIDTGTPTASFPPDFIDRVFAAIPGTSQISSGLWTVPCDTTSILSIEIGGQQFPIHPLDLSIVLPGSPPVCQSSFILAAPGFPFDSLFGDTIMRNLYSLFNFGDNVAKAPTEDATMQFLSVTNATAAQADVANVRMARLSGQQYMSAGFAAAADTASSSSGDSDSLINKYGPIIIGLLGANLVVVLILAVLGVASFVKSSGKSLSRTRSPQYAPVKVGEDEKRTLDGYEDKRYSD